jgi:hypothetical protein
MWHEAKGDEVLLVVVDKSCIGAAPSEMSISISR